jgi:DNA-binding winged helix-turn-helix (wHTH) protein
MPSMAEMKEKISRLRHALRKIDNTYFPTIP